MILRGLRGLCVLRQCRQSASHGPLTLWLQARDDACRARLIAFAHFVDERNRVLQQSHLRLEAVDETLLRRLAGWLDAQRGAAFADRLIDDRQVFLQRGRRLWIERALFGVR